ncbi:acyl carrier protein [Olsenella sp. KGMB02461]|nr:acyl carrier protein [Olsenella sp. KGMB02461]
MNNDEIFEKVADIVAETMSVDADELTLETTFESLSADSLDLIQLVSAIEEDLGITIDDDDLTSIKTLGDAVAMIANAQ